MGFKIGRLPTVIFILFSPSSSTDGNGSESGPGRSMGLEEIAPDGVGVVDESDIKRYELGRGPGVRDC